jgi:hypothetical protein
MNHLRKHSKRMRRRRLREVDIDLKRSARHCLLRTEMLLLTTHGWTNPGNTIAYGSYISEEFGNGVLEVSSFL